MPFLPETTMRVRCVFRRASAALILLTMLFGAVRAASAQSADVQALQREIQELRTELAAVQQEYAERLNALEARLAAGSVPVQATPPPATSKIFNPDIAVVGNLLGAAGRNTISPGPALEMAESEASFQAIVDPYARADFFMAFGEEGVDLEEGFLTFPAIPGGLLVKVGKMRASIGKVNTLHSHGVPWTDRPLVIGNLVGVEMASRKGTFWPREKGPPFLSCGGRRDVAGRCGATGGHVATSAIAVAPPVSRGTFGCVWRL